MRGEREHQTIQAPFTATHINPWEALTQSRWARVGQRLIVSSTKYGAPPHCSDWDLLFHSTLQSAGAGASGSSPGSRRRSSTGTWAGRGRRHRTCSSPVLLSHRDTPGGARVG